MSPVHAFFASGRSRVTVVTGPACSTLTFGWKVAWVSAGVTTGPFRRCVRRMTLIIWMIRCARVDAATSDPRGCDHDRPRSLSPRVHRHQRDVPVGLHGAHAAAVGRREGRLRAAGYLVHDGHHRSVAAGRQHLGDSRRLGRLVRQDRPPRPQAREQPDAQLLVEAGLRVSIGRVRSPARRGARVPDHGITRRATTCGARSSCTS